MAKTSERIQARPSIPLLLQCSFCLWVGCLLSGHFCGLSSTVVVALGSAGVLLICVLLLFSNRTAPFIRNVAARLVFVGLGMLLVAAQFQSLHTKRAALMNSDPASYTMRVLDDPAKGQFGYRATALAWKSDLNVIDRTAASFKVQILFNDDELGFGDEFQTEVVFSDADEASLPYFDQQGLAVRCKLSHTQRVDPSNLGMLTDIRDQHTSTVDALLDAPWVDGNGSAVLKALVVGDRRALFDGDVYGDVKVAGLAHLVAVSGAHLVIVTGLVGCALKVLRAPRRTACAVQFAFLAGYLVMVGFPISCIRAAIMSMIGLFSLAFSRRSYALGSLGATILVLLVLDASAAFSVSFALSALSTLGIVLFTPKFCSWLPNTGKWVESFVFEPLAMTCAAILVTFPLSVSSFSQFSLVSPISNVLAAPLITATCALGVLSFMAMPFAPLCSVFLFCSYGCAAAFTKVVQLLASVPYASVPLDLPFIPMAFCSVALCVVLWGVWPKTLPCKTIGCLLLVVLLLGAGLRIADARSTSVTMLDVGQGDAFLVKSEGTTMLIDTGNQPKKLYAGLARHGVQHLDAVVISHADDDHCGCLADLRGVVDVEEVYVARGMDELGTGKSQGLIKDAKSVVREDEVKELSAGDSISLGAVSFTVLSPSVLEDEGENEDSLCLIGESDLNRDGKTEWRMLFAGDAETNVLDKLANMNVLNDIDILKVSHHGSKASLDDKVLGAMKPEIALISVGERNRYGHPAPNTLNLLADSDVQVFRSDAQGDVVCSLTMDNIAVTAMK